MFVLKASKDKIVNSMLMIVNLILVKMELPVMIWSMDLVVRVHPELLVSFVKSTRTIVHQVSIFVCPSKFLNNNLLPFQMPAITTELASTELVDSPVTAQLGLLATDAKVTSTNACPTHVPTMAPKPVFNQSTTTAAIVKLATSEDIVK